MPRNLSLLMRALLAGNSTPSVPSFYFNFSNPQNVTLGAAQARGTITSTQNAVIAASVSPSRTTGVAPLYVNFDATGTTSTLSTNPSHELFYATDFGDYSAGTWANGVQSSGLTSKNAGYGPVTGHVYETPGTYTVQMVVTDGVNTAVKTGTIVVQDPDVAFTGAATICLSTSGNFTGAPSGAQTFTVSSDMSAHINTYKANNTRILFCKADTWTYSAQRTLSGLTNFRIDGYGTGVARAFGSGTLIPVNVGVLNDAMILTTTGNTDLFFGSMKITVAGSYYTQGGVKSTSMLSVNNTISGITVCKMEIRGQDQGININASQGISVVPEQVCLYEVVTDNQFGLPFFDTPKANSTVTLASPGVFAAVAHPFAVDDKVVLSGTVPTPFVAGTQYFVSATGFGANQFTLSATVGGAAINTTQLSASCDVQLVELHGGIGAYIALTKGGIMGCYFDSCNKGEQTLRIPYIDRGHINNNYVARGNQIKSTFKVHSVIYANWPVYSEKFVISANHITNRGGYSYDGSTINRGYGQMLGVGSGGNGNADGTGGERVRNGIIENNYLEACLGNPKDDLGAFLVTCPNMTIRNNIFDASIGDRTTSAAPPYIYTQLYLLMASTSTRDTSIGIRVYNNTMYSNIANAERANFVRTIPINSPNTNLNVDTLDVKNNLWYLPYYAGADKTATYLPTGTNGNAVVNPITATNTDNGQTAQTSPSFAVTPPVALTDWRPNTGSYAIDTGAIVPVLRDFNMATRVGGAYDKGAVLP